MNWVRPRLEWLLVFVPVPLLSKFVAHVEVLTFLSAAAAIIPLAGIIGGATEQLALHAGPRVGGLLNATFGNVTELIIAIFLILDGDIQIVKASLTGSILGNLLLVLGLSFFVGGLRHEEQEFNEQAAGVHAASLALAVTGLLMPALFLQTSGTHGFVQREVVSGVVAGVLIVLYGGALLFTMVTHQHLFHVPATNEVPRWSGRQATVVLLLATA
ncbi:MAG TPA: cation transporter, partial [Actinomycetota bacterium]